MYRATTPTYIFNVPEEVFLTSATHVYVTFGRINTTVIFTKSDEELEIANHSVTLMLTQEETLSLPDVVLVQLNWLYEEDNITKRACTKTVTINTNRNLLSEVLPWEES